ncbi:LLM class flavin-dependent oxidoreductase [Microtetraspora sp. NBRC 13810]|uniref:LLM class flavin-dependent oxidoreductase n=1 Tax=Microtetraspora sp. NBRC 13810 TaxID=3030990 RepID=UPI0025550784|nr:LLM class flavin-dependent oxidoreductase [Microtetraspora sp. NBRC 13810]
MRLGLTEGDGFITNLLTSEDLAKVLDAAGPRPPGKEIVVKVFVCPTEDADFARRTGRAFLGWILNQTPYRAFHDWLGREHVLRESRARFDAGDRASAARALPDELVDALWVHGSTAECRERIAAFALDGVTSVLLYVAPTPGLLSGRDDLVSVLSRLRPDPARTARDPRSVPGGGVWGQLGGQGVPEVGNRKVVRAGAPTRLSQKRPGVSGALVASSRSRYGAVARSPLIRSTSARSRWSGNGVPPAM